MFCLKHVPNLPPSSLEITFSIMPNFSKQNLENRFHEGTKKNDKSITVCKKDKTNIIHLQPHHAISVQIIIRKLLQIHQYFASQYFSNKDTHLNDDQHIQYIPLNQVMP